MDPSGQKMTIVRAKSTAIPEHRVFQQNRRNPASRYYRMQSAPARGPWPTVAGSQRNPNLRNEKRNFSCSLATKCTTSRWLKLRWRKHAFFLRFSRPSRPLISSNTAHPNSPMKPHNNAQQIAGAAAAEEFHGPRSMSLHGLDADADICGDFLGRLAAAESAQDFALTWRSCDLYQQLAQTG